MTRTEKKSAKGHLSTLTQNPLVAIALATFNPNIEYLRKQIESIKGQTHTRWLCIINDDQSEESIFEAIKTTVGTDSRFLVKQNSERKGVFNNFEAALEEIPPEAALICFCDQDDIWLPSKLEHQIGAFRDCSVVLSHSDLEVIDSNDKPVHPSCWKLEKRNPHVQSFNLLVLRNVVTGCTAMFRRELLDLALPFPHQGLIPSFHHDLWVSLLALTMGKIAPLSEPLVLYRQHANNVLGAEPKGVRRYAKRVLGRNPIRHLNWRSAVTWSREAQADWELRWRLASAVLDRTAKGKASGIPLKPPVISLASPSLDFGFRGFCLLVYSVMRNYHAVRFGTRFFAGKLKRDASLLKARIKRTGP